MCSPVRRAFAFALALSCARALDLPSAAPLSVSPAFVSVAPREKLTLAAEGGAGGYLFSFAQGGQLSGFDATIDPRSGAYQAGAQGSAQDLVDVVDAAGARVQARITVTQRLFLSPGAVTIAPGGRVHFIATGGKPPYRFELGSAPAGMTLDGATGAFFAGPTGNLAVDVTVRDDTLDDAALDTARVSVGSPLRLFAPGKEGLTPYGAIDLIATGGQPPYAYLLAGNSGGTVDAETGQYRAGPNGGAGVEDVVTVTDAFAQTAAQSLHPGPPLAARLESQDLHPGVAVRVLASGGKPPYAFRLAPRGNRSLGAIDALSGSYTPGVNYAAADVIEVTDATPGVPAVATVAAPPVGAVRIPQCASLRVIAADLNGDRRKDLVCLSLASPTSAVTTIILPLDGAPVVSTYDFGILGSGTVNDAVAMDVNLDGHDDLVVLTRGRLWFLLADFAGQLPRAIPAAGRLLPFVVPFTNATLAAQRGRSSFYYVDGASGACNPDSGIVRVDWDTTVDGPKAPVCAISLGTATPTVTEMAAGDFDGDGSTDLAWSDSLHPEVLNIRYGPAFAPLGTAADAVPAGAGLVFTVGQRSSSLDGAANALLSGTWTSSVAWDLLALVDEPATGRRGVVSMPHDGARAPVASAFYEVFKGVAPFGIAPVAPTVFATDQPVFVPWYPARNTLPAFGFDLQPRNPPAAPRTFGVDSVAATDVDGDSLNDLLVTDLVFGTEILPGEGDGSFGRRVHARMPLTGIKFPVDFDGDGADDVVMGTPLPGLQVLFGAGHQVAYGPETGLEFAPANFAAERFTGGTQADVIAADSSLTLRLLRGRPDGSFAAPETMHDSAGEPAVVESNIVLPARFGSDAPSDLIVRMQTLRLQPIVRSGVDPLLAVAGGPTPLPAGVPFPIVPVDLDGDGVADIAVGYSVTGGPHINVSFAAGRGSAVSFGAWQDVYTGASGGQLWTGAPLRSRRAGFLVGRGQSGFPEVVAVEAAGSPPEAHAIVTQIPVEVGTLVNGAIFGRFNDDPEIDVAIVLFKANRINSLQVYFGASDGTFVAGPSTPLAGALPVPMGAIPNDVLIHVGNGLDWFIAINRGDGSFK